FIALLCTQEALDEPFSQAVLRSQWDEPGHVLNKRAEEEVFLCPNHQTARQGLLNPTFFLGLPPVPWTIYPRFSFAGSLLRPWSFHETKLADFNVPFLQCPQTGRTPSHLIFRLKQNSQVFRYTVRYVASSESLPDSFPPMLWFCSSLAESLPSSSDVVSAWGSSSIDPETSISMIYKPRLVPRTQLSATGTGAA
ncbi:unnamed protein product, partial [Heterosigma akashiwo]